LKNLDPIDPEISNKTTIAYFGSLVITGLISVKLIWAYVFSVLVAPLIKSRLTAY